LARDLDIEGESGNPTQALNIQNHCDRMEKTAKSNSTSQPSENSTKVKEKKTCPRATTRQTTREGVSPSETPNQVSPKEAPSQVRSPQERVSLGTLFPLDIVSRKGTSKEKPTDDPPVAGHPASSDLPRIESPKGHSSH
jgi:hypothetical protein